MDFKHTVKSRQGELTDAGSLQHGLSQKGTKRNEKERKTTKNNENCSFSALGHGRLCFLFHLPLLMHEFSSEMDCCQVWTSKLASHNKLDQQLAVICSLGCSVAHQGQGSQLGRYDPA
jgi:hypothetical protein